MNLKKNIWLTLNICTLVVVVDFGVNAVINSPAAYHFTTTPNLIRELARDEDLNHAKKKASSLSEEIASFLPEIASMKRYYQALLPFLIFCFTFNLVLLLASNAGLLRPQNFDEFKKSRRSLYIQVATLNLASLIATICFGISPATRNPIPAIFEEHLNVVNQMAAARNIASLRQSAAFLMGHIQNDSMRAVIFQLKLGISVVVLSVILSLNLFFVRKQRHLVENK